MAILVETGFTNVGLLGHAEAAGRTVCASGGNYLDFSLGIGKHSVNFAGRHERGFVMRRKLETKF